MLQPTTPPPITTTAAVFGRVTAGETARGGSCGDDVRGRHAPPLLPDRTGVGRGEDCTWRPADGPDVDPARDAPASPDREALGSAGWGGQPRSSHPTAPLATIRSAGFTCQRRIRAAMAKAMAAVEALFTEVRARASAPAPMRPMARGARPRCSDCRHGHAARCAHSRPAPKQSTLAGRKKATMVTAAPTTPATR